MIHLHLPIALGKIGFTAKLAITVVGAAIIGAILEPHEILVPLWISMVVAVSAIITPLISAWTRSREERRRWDREDKVAEEKLVHDSEVAERVEGVRKAAVETSNRVEEVAREAAKTNTSIAEVHDLVDGQLTLIMQSELDSKKVQMALMKEVIELKRTDRDITPSEETLAVLAQLQSEIVHLSERIERRHEIERLAAEKRATR